MSDLISRQQAIDMLLADPVGKNLAERYNLVGWLEGLPSIEPRKKGRWLYSDGTPAELWGSYGVYCSACKEQSEEASNFCGNCGADMR